MDGRCTNNSLDKDKLRNIYKIRPYRSYDDAGEYEDEMEEVIDRNITNLDKYIIKVILPNSTPEIESLLKEKISHTKPSETIHRHRNNRYLYHS